MKKRIIRITIFVMLFFIVFSVKAANKTYTQSGVNSSYENYKSALTELKDLKCDGELYTQALVDKCNNIELQKSVSLTYLFNAKNNNKELIDSEIQKVLDSNEENCKTAVSKDLQDMINKIYLMFFIAGPILLIFFGSLDATKAIVVGDEKTRKGLYTKLFKRVIALVLLFASPAIVNLLINTFGASKYSANIYTCSYTHKKITIRYTPVIISNGRYGSGVSNPAQAGSIIEAAAAINKVSSAKRWSYTCTGINSIISHYESNTYGQMCCADYVSAVLYLSGTFTKDEINGMTNVTSSCGEWRGHTYATGVQAFLRQSGWIQITDPSDLQAGDIVFVKPKSDDVSNCIGGPVRSGHVEIYAGDGKKYNAGSTDAMRSNGPYNVSYSKPYFIEAYRVPISGSRKK